MAKESFSNPFRPGAGHMPPYLAGREREISGFKKLLEQDLILENMVLTGLRGVGKTVLLDKLKPLAQQRNWLWAGTDLSESTSISEERAVQRLLTDLSLITSHVVFTREKISQVGFVERAKIVDKYLNYETLCIIYASTPGLVADKLKATLELVWVCLRGKNVKGIIFAYDEAQTMSDHNKKDQYPLSLVLDVFQSIQKKRIPFMLVLTGLPTLFPNLVPKQASYFKFQYNRVDDFIRTQLFRPNRLAG